MSDLETNTRYDPGEVEPRIVRRWLESGLFHPEPAGSPEENYSIAIPPPNVTGVLHMGHALNSAVQDTLIRYQRSRGRRAKWILGTDHAGIATQTQVERALESEGTSREQLGREAFEQRVWQWREQYGGAIIEQLKRMGASCDYEEERFTLDEQYAKAVMHVFVALYQKGYIYRDRYMVNWDPGMRSAISDLEVEDREVSDPLYYIDYPLASGSGAITVATVRPETMLADTAIAVNPADERYERLIGEHAILPLVSRRLKIIADDYVKPDFGTGALKITPGHDPNDFDIGQRHGLPVISVIGEDGTINDEAPERFRGLRVLEAREAVVAELRDQGLVARTDEYVHTVPFSHRSGERIEPLISLQWFMRMDELARPAIDAVTSGRVKFHPERWQNVYLQWMENIRPWVISRQLWWGHRLPVYYRGDEVYVGTEPPEGEGWERDPDVLDTWFSSALWPFATLGWPDPTPELRAFYPTDALVTGRDIIFLWVARMIMMGLEFTEQIPFSDVHITAIIQAPDGRRMSKSLGTGIDPLDLINGGLRPPVFEEGGEFPPYGADAVRWGLLAMSSGQDVRFSEEKVAQGQQLTNKLWNASRLILLGVGPDARAALRPAAVEDRWILSRLERARAEVSSRIERYDFSHAALALYDYVFGELCDWYLELVKPRLREGDPELSATLLYVLTETLTLAHPLIPFVTEEIYAHVPGGEGLLAARVAGERSDAAVDEQVEAAVASLIEAVQALRGWRDYAGVTRRDPNPGAAVRGRLRGDRPANWSASRGCRCPPTAGDPVASVPVPGGTIEILAERRARSRRDRAQAGRRAGAARRLISSSRERKLANPGFVAKAPPAVVQAERDKLEQLRAEREALERTMTPRRPSATCSRSSCSGCGSAWIACGG